MSPSGQPITTDMSPPVSQSQQRCPPPISQSPQRCPPPLAPRPVLYSIVSGVGAQTSSSIPRSLVWVYLKTEQSADPRVDEQRHALQWRKTRWVYRWKRLNTWSNTHTHARTHARARCYRYNGHSIIIIEAPSRRRKRRRLSIALTRDGKASRSPLSARARGAE